MKPFVKNQHQIKLEEYITKRYSDKEILELIKIEIQRKKALIGSAQKNKITFYGGVFIFNRVNLLKFIDFGSIQLIEQKDQKFLQYNYWIITPYIALLFLPVFILINFIQHNGLYISTFAFIVSLVICMIGFWRQKQLLVQLKRKLRYQKYGSSLL
ncbi:MAG: hypothetical protein KTR26_12940 [Flammeovirgaceae bacterium]|nr:hypothetical protein [Flammeovirgaceae bacterium]